MSIFDELHAQMDKLGIARFGGITLAPDAKPTSEELAAELLASLKQIEQDIINGTIREVFCYDSQEIIDAVGMTEEEIEADRELFEFLSARARQTQRVRWRQSKFESRQVSHLGAFRTQAP